MKAEAVTSMMTKKTKDTISTTNASATEDSMMKEKICGTMMSETKRTEFENAMMSDFDEIEIVCDDDDFRIDKITASKAIFLQSDDIETTEFDIFRRECLNLSSTVIFIKINVCDNV